VNWNFWKTEKREDVQLAPTNQEIALDLMTMIRHKSTENQREIVYTLVRHVFDDCHIHSNPRKRTTDDIVA